MAMKNNEYWEMRTKASEAKAHKMAASAVKRTAATYKQAYKQMDDDIAHLFTQLQRDGMVSITRTDLWRYAKYRQLQNDITHFGNVLGADQISILDEVLGDIFKTTIGNDVDFYKNKAFNPISDDQVKQIINEDWKESNYSRRVWGNTRQLTQRLSKEITDMIVLGKTPDEIRKQMKFDMNVSSRHIDRLIRTEAQHIYNVAAKERYARAGIQKVKYIAEEDSDQFLCQCHDFKDQIFILGEEPELPQHPNCRCCYAPVIEFDDDD